MIKELRQVAEMNPVPFTEGGAAAVAELREMVAEGAGLAVRQYGRAMVLGGELLRWVGRRGYHCSGGASAGGVRSGRCGDRWNGQC